MCALLVAVTFCISSNVFSQTITLGSGTTVNDVTASSPINIWFRKTVAQMVYTADELTAEGAVAGPITQLGFFITNNPIYNLPDYTIQIKHTNAANAAGNLEGGYTTVKTIASYAPSTGGWDMLTLDTPFEWNGTSNIVVRICWSRVTPSYDPSGQLRVYNATNGYKYRRNDSGGSACGSVPNTVSNTKPQIRFIFLSETEWTGAISSDWFNANNWTAGVPEQTMDALIPAGTPNNPVLDGIGNCKSLQLLGDFTLEEAGTLNIYEHFTSLGNFNDLGGTTVFTGMLAHEIEANPPLTMMNLHCNSAAGLTITDGHLIIGKELRVNKGIFNTGDALTLRSDASGTARVDKLRTTCTYTLNMTDTWGDGWNGGFLTVLEDGEPIGEFVGTGYASTATFLIETGGVVTLNYTAGSFENENGYSLVNEEGTTIFSDVITPVVGDVFTDIAVGCSFSSSIIGDVTMERYINEGETYWRYFASAVEEPTLEQYIDDFTTAGFPGSPFPDFPFISIYSYDETMPPGWGYVPASGTDQVMEVGQGYQVWCGDTITGTEAFVVDLTGPLNQGDISLPVTFTPSGTPSEDGWCLIANPYASTIDWRSANWTKVGLADATYIQDPDTEHYATYISGASANGGSRFIASQQSFWVHALTASPELLIHESVKSNVDADFKTAPVYSPGMTIQLSAEGQETDEAVLRHIDGATDAVEAEFDAVKMYGGWGVNPQVMLLNSEGEDLTVHSFDKGLSAWTVPLRTIVFENGTYDLTFNNVGELDVPCLKLEDRYTGIYYAVEEGITLSFELADTAVMTRFYLHLGRNYKDEVTDLRCADEAKGQYLIDMDEEGDFFIEIFSGDESFTTYGSINPLVLNDLAAGDYTFKIDDFNHFCEDSIFTFTIGSPEPLVVNPKVKHASTGYDGEIDLVVNGGVAPYLFEWSNGMIAEDVTGLSEGLYTVTVIDANDCEDEQSVYIGSSVGVATESNEVAVIYNGLNKQMQLTKQASSTAETVVLYSIHGGAVAEFLIPPGQNEFILTLPQSLSNGIYILKPQQGNWFYRFNY